MRTRVDKGGLEKNVCIIVRWTFTSFPPSVVFQMVFSLSAPGVKGGRTQYSSTELKKAEPVLTSTGARLSSCFPVFAPWNLGLCFQTTCMFLTDKYEKSLFVH